MISDHHYDKKKNGTHCGYPPTTHLSMNEIVRNSLQVTLPALLQLYSNGLPVSELPQDGNTGEISGLGTSNSTSELVQDKEMEATGGTRGSGNSVELENKNSDHKMEDNLGENHHVKLVQRKYK